MEVRTEDSRIILYPEDIREAYKIGRLSKLIGNTTTLEGDTVKMAFNVAEIFELQRIIEEKR